MRNTPCDLHKSRQAHAVIREQSVLHLVLQQLDHGSKLCPLQEVKAAEQAGARKLHLKIILPRFFAFLRPKISRLFSHISLRLPLDSMASALFLQEVFVATWINATSSTQRYSQENQQHRPTFFRGSQWNRPSPKFRIADCKLRLLADWDPFPNGCFCFASRTPLVPKQSLMLNPHGPA